MGHAMAHSDGHARKRDRGIHGKRGIQIDQAQQATATELDRLINETCYRPDGRLNRDEMMRLIADHHRDLSAVELFWMYGRMMYRPDKDLHLKFQIGD